MLFSAMAGPMWIWTCLILLVSSPTMLDVQAWIMTSTQGRHARSMKSHLCSSLINNNNNNNNNTIEMTSTDSNKRRQIIEGSIVALTSASLGFLASSSSALAAAADKPAEFLNVGTQAPPPEGSNPFVTLENGVKVKDIKLGKGEEAVTPNSRVDIQCSGRLLNLNGVSFYNTKNNNPDGFGAIPLSIDLGKGQAIPGLESGLVGMKKSGVRRIIVPQELAYNKFPDLEPKPMTQEDQRALDSVVKNPRRDGAILFDVQLERLK